MRVRLRSNIGLLECSQQGLNVGGGLLGGHCDAAQSADDAEAREEGDEPAALTLPTLLFGASGSVTALGFSCCNNRALASPPASEEPERYFVDRAQGLTLSSWTLTTLGPASRVPTAVKSC